MANFETYTIDISFVILHYNVIKETVNCINSIKESIDTEKYHIAVVDNNSPNKTGSILAEMYKEDKNVTVLLSKDNVGFARGNNLGIDYLREHYFNKYICCLNNDTLLIQKDFYTCLEKEYQYSNAAVIGPKILLKDDSTQLFNEKLETLEIYELQLKKFKCTKNISNMIKEHIRKMPLIYEICLKIMGRKSIQCRKEYANKRHIDIILHGSCLIFTPTFFSCLDGFNPKTFLYREEELLYISLKKNNLLSVYCPSLVIKHLEDAATDSVNKSKKDKNDFIKYHQIISTQILIDELKEGL